MFATELSSLLGQLVERCTGIAEVMGSNIFRSYVYYCSSSVHYCEDLFHIHVFIRSSNIFTVVYSSLHGFIWNQHNGQLPVGLLAQLVERYTGIAEVMGSNPVQA